MAGVFKTVTFLIFGFVAVVFAEDYDVGEDTKWTRPTDLEFYNTWAAGKTFLVGDQLEFEFAAGRHDVAEVTQAAYENCDTEKPLSVVTTSPATITLKKAGTQYFICTFADHCRFGQKLAVTVVGPGGAAGGPGGAAAGAAGGPGGATNTTAPVAGPAGGATTSTTSTTTPTGSETTTGSTATTTSTGSTPTTEAPTSDASSLSGATFLVAFVSAFAALF